MTAGELFNSNHFKGDVFIPSVFRGQHILLPHI